MEYCIKAHTVMGRIFYLKEYEGKASKFTLNKAEAFTLDDLYTMEILGDAVCNTIDHIGGDPVHMVLIEEDAGPA